MECNPIIYTKADQSTSHCISTHTLCSIPVRFVSSIVLWRCRSNSLRVPAAAAGQINTNSMYVKTNKYWHYWDANNAWDTASVETALIRYYDIIIGGLTALQAGLVIKMSDWNVTCCSLIHIQGHRDHASSPIGRSTLLNTPPHATFHKIHCSAPILHWFNVRHD